jgi:hypothetical protein
MEVGHVFVGLYYKYVIQMRRPEDTVWSDVYRTPRNFGPATLENANSIRLFEEQKAIANGYLDTAFRVVLVLPNGYVPYQ